MQQKQKADMTMNRIPLYLALTFVSRTGFPTEYHQFTANFPKKEERFFRRPLPR